MGYITNFKLEMYDGNGSLIDASHPAFPKLATEFARIFNGEFFKEDELEDNIHLLNSIVEYSSDWKWYEHDADMSKLAALFPDFKFSLEGEGEEKSDWWVHWWENGRLAGESSAQLIEPDFPDWSENGLYFA
jgi:hypothetical protein